MNRRSYLKAAGGIATIGTVAALSMTSASAQATSISSSNATVTNDRGDVSSVTIDPSFRVEWSNLDDAVGKVFYLIEAKIGDGGYHPIFRATPWLTGTDNGEVKDSGPGTTGYYEIINSHSNALASDDRLSGSASPLIVADETGKPDYEGIDWSIGTRTSYETFIDGTSMSSADEYEGLGFQNNYPDLNAGYYGAAANANTMDNPDDGSDKPTTVTLRYTFELQRPNISYMQSITGKSTEDTSKLAKGVSGVRSTDIDSGNSKIIMNGEDGNTDFASPSGITYADLQSNASSHVGIITTTTSFTVTATNEASTNDTSGTSNTGAS